MGRQDRRRLTPELFTLIITMSDTTTQIVAIPDEKCTELVRNYNGTQVGIVWAGCFYGPEDSITKVANGDLLAKCEALLEDPNTPWLPAKFVDCDNGLGPINIAD